MRLSTTFHMNFRKLLRKLFPQALSIVFAVLNFARITHTQRGAELIIKCLEYLHVSSLGKPKAEFI